MPKLYNVLFASSNKHKYEEAEKILAEFGIKLEFFQTDLIEIQSDSLSEIALKKVLDAYDKCKKPVIVEDDGLFINSLSGFPGPFSSYVFKTIGNNGILKLIGSNRSAQFRAVIAFCDSNKKPVFFESNVFGEISKNIQGKGWGYDPIFVPENQNKTYAELAEKNKLSHRYQSLKKFASHYIRIIEGTPCPYCGNDMSQEGGSKSCIPIVIIDGKKYTRDNSENSAPFGTDIYPGKDVACGDCGVINGIHHLGCDVERCPKHPKKQFITCDCSKNYDIHIDISQVS